jgi:Spy/CpxP family protein refolding chaperone
MITVLNTARNSFLAGCLVAACPLFAIASPPEDAPFAGGACALEFHRPGPPMGPPFLGPPLGTQQQPPYLMGLTLTEDQEDKVFAILHAAEPALREQEKAVRKARDGLRDLGRSAQFDAGSAATLAQALGKAESQLTLLRVRADHDVLSVLTAEQKTEISRLESERESHRPAEHPTPR